MPAIFGASLCLPIGDVTIRTMRSLCLYHSVSCAGDKKYQPVGTNDLLRHLYIVDILQSSAVLTLPLSSHPPRAKWVSTTHSRRSSKLTWGPTKHTSPTLLIVMIFCLV